jgi:3-hydroxyisobutyrate dehydrogenase-like beta-hydroxyacid dehydrogenase
LAGNGLIRLDIMTATITIGFIGLGDQGAPIAARIVQGGFALRVWARRAASAEPLAKLGAHVDDSKAALAAACDVVGVCVATDDQTREVLLGPDGVFAHMRPGGIVLIHATLLPDTVIELEAAAHEHRLRLLDAPVSGGRAGAEAGTMTVMIGGDADTLAAVLPVLRTFASNIPLLGPVGSGQMMKLLNNNLNYANIAMGIAALELAAQLGMDQRVAAQVIATSSGASHGFELLQRNDRFAKLTGGTSNVKKDTAHFVEIVEARGLGDNPLTAVSKTTFERLTAFAPNRFKSG